MTTTTRCAKCGYEMLASDRMDKRGSHAAAKDCMKAQQSGRAYISLRPATPAPIAPASTPAPTVRAVYAQAYAVSAPRGTCKGCGGPVSAGGTSCGEC